MQGTLWPGLEFKLNEADFFLSRMSKVLTPDRPKLIFDSIQSQPIVV